MTESTAYTSDISASSFNGEAKTFTNKDGSKGLKLGFPRRKGTENLENDISVTGIISASEQVLDFNGLLSKRRLVTMLNIDLKSSTVSGDLFVRRTYQDGTYSDSRYVSLRRFIQGDTYQSNQVTIKQAAIYLGVNDKLYLSIDKTDTGSVTINVDGEYILLD